MPLKQFSAKVVSSAVMVSILQCSLIPQKIDITTKSHIRWINKLKYCKTIRAVMIYNPTGYDEQNQNI